MLDRPGCDLGTGAESETVQDVLDVVFGSPLANYESARDLTIGASLGDEHRDFALSRAQHTQRRVTTERRLQVRARSARRRSHTQLAQLADDERRERPCAQVLCSAERLSQTGNVIAVPQGGGLLVRAAAVAP